MMPVRGASDSIDRVREEWAEERPDLDTSPMDIIGRIMRIQFLTAVRLRRLFRRHELDWSGFDVLATLRRSGPPYRLTPTHLYEALVLTSGAMTHRLDALERSGLIERVPDPTDGRSMLAGLTRKGRAVIDKAIEEHLAGEAELTAPLTKAERADLARLLRKLLLELERTNARA